MTIIVTDHDGNTHCAGCGEQAVSPDGHGPDGRCPDGEPHDWYPGLDPERSKEDRP